LYDEALSAFADPSRLLGSIEAGRASMNVHPDRAAENYRYNEGPNGARGAPRNTAERQAFRIGLADEYKLRMGEMGHGHDRGKLFNSPNAEQRMAAISPAGADRFTAYRAGETELTKSNNRILRGSDTAENLANADTEALPALQRFGAKVMQGKPAAAALDAVVTGWRVAYGFRNQDARELATALMSTDAATRNVTIARLGQKYGQRQVNRAMMQAQGQLTNAMLGLSGANAVGNALTQPPVNALAQPAQNELAFTLGNP
jgi:hypothetical protein